MDQEARKKALQMFTYGVYVVGSKAGEDVNAYTASWLTQTSFEPPLVMIASKKANATDRLVREGGIFSVNILGDNQKDLAEHFFQPRQRTGSKLGDVHFHQGATGAPILDEALAFVECRVVETIEKGDHTIYLGEVVEAGVICPGEPLTMKDTGWHYGG